ncbi:MAG: dihydrofolate reductase [Muribaculaceae bacterium]|nr:dihydrofolate reductase [Muribaculaceae bacterium]MDE6754384.1 dihydrofolate reductase [Muribaculaceae bacterium]
MEINMIVAAGRDGAIGKQGDLIWHLPGDLKRFKSLTMGHTVVMGRKTWESLPKRPLPGRRNIVVTHNPEYVAEGAEVMTGVEEVIESVGGSSPFIMGGGEIYRLFYPFVTRVCLTEADAVCEDADARISLPGENDEWEKTEESEWHSAPDGLRFRYVEYRRRQLQ